MLPARYAATIALLYMLSALSSVVALSRIIGTPPYPNSTAERIAWLIWSAVLLALGITLYVFCKRAESDECTHDHCDVACQAQRNATIYAGVLMWSSAAEVVMTALATANAVLLSEALIVHVALLAPLTVWYFASATFYLPRRRLAEPTDSAKKNI